MSGIILALVVFLALVICQIPGNATAASSGPTVLKTCSYAALNTAVQKGGVIRFACSGTVSFAATIYVTKTVTIDAAGCSVTFDGQSKWQLFQVNSGSLTLVNLTLANAFVVGEDGYPSQAVTPWDLDGDPGSDGAAGSNGADGNQDDHDGQPGGPGANGQFGGVGGDANNGGGGGAGQGGAIVVAPGAQLVVIGGTFKNDDAKGGLGGMGGAGGKGGDGGNGGVGGDGGGGAVDTDLPAGNGGSGGNGGNAGNAGKGSDGGLGAAGAGGAIYSQGTVTIVGTTFSDDTATGGAGGDAGLGGAGGVGGSGGNPGNGGYAGSATDPPDPEYWFGSDGWLGDAGSGADGGAANAPGKAGQGGAGLGGAIYSSGTLRVFNATFTATVAQGGSGGNGGSARDPGAGGGGQEGAVGGNGGAGGYGASGTNGGDGSGGAIYTEKGSTTVIESCTFSAAKAEGDEGGSGGDGSSGADGGGGGMTDDGLGGDAAAGGGGGNGGNGGTGGMGGSGIGGAVHVGSAMSESSLTFKSCTVTGAAYGMSGAAGDGGAGGAGGPVNGSNVVGAAGAPGSDGINGYPGVKGSAVNPQIDGATQPLAYLAVSKKSGSLAVGMKSLITLSVKSGTAPYKWQALSLPPGLTLNSKTGKVSGKPTTAGTFTLAVLVTDSASGTHRMGAANFTIKVAK